MSLQHIFKQLLRTKYAECASTLTDVSHWDAMQVCLCLQMCKVGCLQTFRMRLSLKTKLVMLATKMKMDGKTAPHKKMIP